MFALGHMNFILCQPEELSSGCGGSLSYAVRFG